MTKKQLERNQKLAAMCLDYNATVNVSYCGMKGNKYKVHEIVGTRVTIKTDRLIDFNINEVVLHPISYCAKEYNQIQSINKN